MSRIGIGAINHSPPPVSHRPFPVPLLHQSVAPGKTRQGRHLPAEAGVREVMAEVRPAAAAVAAADEAGNLNVPFLHHIFVLYTVLSFLFLYLYGDFELALSK